MNPSHIAPLSFIDTSPITHALKQIRKQLRLNRALFSESIELARLAENGYPIDMKRLTRIMHKSRRTSFNPLI